MPRAGAEGPHSRAARVGVGGGRHRDLHSRRRLRQPDGDRAGELRHGSPGARAVALDSGADACAAIRRELHLAASFDCKDQWQITIDRGVDPAGLSALIAGTEGNTTASGELVLVRIGWKQTGSASDAASEAENASAGSESTSGDDSESTDPIQADPVPMVAMGIARSEPEAS